jgi:hypothetical protein
MAQTQVPAGFGFGAFISNHPLSFDEYKNACESIKTEEQRFVDRCKMISKSKINIHCITESFKSRTYSRDVRISESLIGVSSNGIGKKLISLAHGTFYEKFKGLDNPKTIISSSDSFGGGFSSSGFGSSGFGSSGFGSSGFGSSGFGISNGGFGEYGIYGGSQFYLTFNTFDGKKQIESVDDAKEIESIVLEYKFDSGISSELNRKIQSRLREIETLKNERNTLCELIDRTFIANDSICDALREKHPRFFELKTVKEMHDEFEFINEQIHIGSQEVSQFERYMEETKTQNNEGMRRVTIPYGKIVKINIFNEYKKCSDGYDCYWRYINTDDHDMNQKKSDSFMEINDVEMTKKYIIDGASDEPLNKKSNV